MNRHAPMMFSAVCAALMIAYGVAIFMGVCVPAVHADSQSFPIPSPSPAATP